MRTVARKEEMIEMAAPFEQSETLKEWAAREKVPLGSAYHLSRVDAIPGLYRIGRRVRIRTSEYEAVRQQKGSVG